MCGKVFSFSNFFMQLKWQSSIRLFSQIWLQTRHESGKKLESFYILDYLLKLIIKFWKRKKVWVELYTPQVLPLGPYLPTYPPTHFHSVGVNEQKSSNPCKTSFINTSLIQKMYRGIKNKGEFKGLQVSTNTKVLK